MVGAVASGATAEPARHTAEIAAKVETAGTAHPHLRFLSLPQLLANCQLHPRQQPHQPSQLQLSKPPTQTARQIRTNAPLLTPAPTDCVAASGATADQAQDTVEIAARVEIVGPREGNQAIADTTVGYLSTNSTKIKPHTCVS